MNFLMMLGIACCLLFLKMAMSSGVDDSFDQKPTYSQNIHQKFLAMPDTMFNQACIGTRATSMLMISNFLSRQSVGAQLAFEPSSKPHYKSSLLNHLKNYYGGGGIRAFNFLIHNGVATQFLKHGQDLNPWLFTGITGIYGILSTPFEALSTQKIHTLCEWSSGKRRSPLSYYAIIKENYRYLFRGAFLNSLIYGGSWPLFMGYVNAIKNDFDGLSLENPIHMRHTIFYSCLWSGLEVAALNPLFVMQRRMQQKPQIYPTVQKTCLKLLNEEGYKTFYRGSGAAFTSILTSTIIDFFILQYLWAREK